ncbi:hypothetical protein HKX48_002621 [Thoreauomyces humboldtii]|nr:hypothetical protein HKX48_002621 [Thoreauomyces humboldtii]
MRYAFLVAAFALASAAPVRKDDAAPVCGALPDYVLTYAPMLYLQSGEGNFLADPAGDFLNHVTVKDNTGTTLAGPTPITGGNLNDYPSGVIWLTSDDDPQTNPVWLQSPVGKPADGTERSGAPISIITVNQADGSLIAYYMFFYAYNHGPKVLGRNYGNHVGDWEYTAIRFESGTPTQMYFSEHDAGTAVDFSIVELDANSQKPITYVAVGSHANYPTNGNNGKHPYSLPLGVLADYTSDASSAIMVDASQNYRGYCYSAADGFQATHDTPDKDVSWLQWAGNWGDKQYPNSDPRQYGFAGQYHYVNGPTGPVQKNLLRVDICEKTSGSACVIETSVDSVEAIHHHNKLS